MVLPAYMAIAVTWGVALSRWMSAPDASGWRAPGVALLCVVQLAWLFYDPRPLTPGEPELRAGDAFIESMRRLDGEVLATWHGYIPLHAGKKVYAHRSAIHDVMRSHDSPTKEALRQELIGALDRQEFGAIIVDFPLFTRDYMQDALNRNYRSAGPMLEPGLEVGGLLGFRANPHVYLPIDGAERRR